MKRKINESDERERLSLAESYRRAAMEDLGTLELLYECGFRYPHNACMHIARASEKLMKSKLLTRGTNPGWTHDQVEMMSLLGFSEDDPLMKIATRFTIYAVESNYPSPTRDEITTDTAHRSYDEMFALIDVVSKLEPETVAPSKPCRKEIRSVQTE